MRSVSKIKLIIKRIIYIQNANDAIDLKTPSTKKTPTMLSYLPQLQKKKKKKKKKKRKKKKAKPVRDIVREEKD
jgi:hypothetical protein